MLHLIPAPLHRVLYRVANRARRVWWRLSKPQRRSAFVLAFDAGGRVLLVRHSYGPPVWTLPGGGVNRTEEPAEAAAREFDEELRCRLEQLRLMNEHVRTNSGSVDRQYLFTGRLVGTPRVDMRELVAAELFEAAALPEPISAWAAANIRAAVAERTG